MSISKDLRNVPKEDVPKLLKCIEFLADNPRSEGCIKLSGQENYRVQQGSYRIAYEIRDEVLVVNVNKVAHRSDAYKNN
ncbi:Type II toxin-antitoxin system mRNA interferase toxin, RelE/StbE family [Candidatus Nitrotoga sp. BS]|uniref:type II toxin-antitoxin system RelE family toxin n=1 Tax=Candidatus Nitrotoga sp. BS TaxID=2890408 RepID=UPI001EF16A56|nr:type II toxin-antitoxin system RelE/ParE family toxin [Candidatus Nitrotoga sp. BS]CAH1205838.1 Type II toxin-antitoxin system mRNA interferase toxin, RelE/StbE family [Candidatus Nitrotoga sp. BS]